ncbi:MAG: hypothetical protein UW22_C0005G0016 [Candidatus Gottesmanbacteria bacterium GW2011_GWB1_44_11c]|uniref:Uncharacterized protein n=1 Tax=Candidatus Gottesmanbacteria bacterium GW2011_GWB1_44_11c TaxID=1618447 RepID=A0A0G1J468_9BACT|nr:MAG: hypothetical protein UW22_C0005G0016 [Candidatus Gottesmanbacteria bacterium GW2011_GWB1_44_11c]
MKLRGNRLKRKLHNFKITGRRIILIFVCESYNCNKFTGYIG